MEFLIKQLSPVTVSFLVLISCLCLIFHARFTDKDAHNGPTILTTVGIFATFVGITLALWNFNTANIQGSVPSLLDGLKTAFFSSAFGIFCALTLKLREYVWGVPAIDEEFGSHREATGADIVAQLRKVTNALVGREEGSLITQIKLSRQDSNDRLDALKAAQTEALAKLSELGSKALVQALRDVIRDFNQKLTEQFGENFKELNAAVGQLLSWQDQYKKIVETTVQKFNAIAVSMAKATADYASLVEKSDSLARAGETLNTTATSLRAEMERLEKVSAALASLLKSAEGSLPQVEQKVLALTSQLTNAVMENQKQIGIALSENATATRNSLQSASESLKGSHKEHSSQISELVAKTKEQLTALTSQLTNAVMENQRQVGTALTENATATRNSLQSANESLTTSHEEHSSQIAKLVEKTKEQVTVLDKALSEELEKPLTSLGRQLTALSEKFVADYAPLTDKLRRAVEIAR
jgi:predicted  nucleic acid-binding Zn-ribbon protein